MKSSMFAAPRGSPHLFISLRVQTSVPDVFDDRPLEQQRVLMNDRDVLPQRRQCEVARVLPVEQDLGPARWWFAPDEQVHQRCLACSGRADDCNPRPCPTRNEMSRSVSRALIREAHISKLDRATLHARSRPRRTGRARRFRVQQIEHAFEPDEQVLSGSRACR